MYYMIEQMRDVLTLGDRIFPLEEGTCSYGMKGETNNVKMRWDR